MIKKNKKFIGAVWRRGSSTLEMLIAMAILVISLTTVIVASFGNQSLSTDTQTNSEAITGAANQLGALALVNFATIVPTTTAAVGGDIYNKETKVVDYSACLKEVTSALNWSLEKRPQEVGLATYLTDQTIAAALGGDCPSAPPAGGWNPPALFARDTINPGKFSTLDALQKIIYLGSDDTKPYLFIADTRGAVFNDSSNQPLIIGDSIHYANSFNSDGKTIDEINDIDAYKDVSSGKTYAFIATASTTAQLAVIDVTDIRNPVLVARRKLKDVTAVDSTAWGWQLYYYDEKLYITSRETAGPEFHIFDVVGLLSNPSNPTPPDPSDDEIGRKELNTTVNDFVIRDGLAYFADESDARGPLLIYDVSTLTEVMGARTIFLDNTGNPSNEKNGESVFLLGNKLYFGRERTPSGPEFYIFDVSDPRTAVGGLPVFGRDDLKKEMDMNVTDIRVIGRFAFLASYGDSSGGFKVWDISDPLSIQPIDLTFNFGNKLRAIDYEPDFIYASGGSTPNFQILYSP